MRIPLAATWQELSDKRTWNSDPLEFLQVVNYLRATSWSFEITHRSDALDLQISRSPSLQAADLAILLSGRVHQLLFGQTIEVTFRDRTHVVRLTAELGGTIDIPCDTSEDVLSVRLVGAIGDRLSPALGDIAHIQSYLVEHTLIGASVDPTPQLSVSVRVLGVEHTYRHQARIEKFLGRSLLTSKTKIRIPSLGASALLAAKGGKYSASSFHSAFGRFPCSSSIEAQLSEHEGLSFFLEIADKSLVRDTTGQLGPPRRAQQVLDCISQEIAKPAIQADLLALARRVREDDHRMQAERLRERSIAASRRQKVYVDSKPVFCRPQNENETVALYMKLEALGLLPAHECSVIEYTPRAGIDALVHYQRTATAYHHQYAPVEFEYDLRNFFQHGHPVDQVALVICWQYAEEDPDLPPEIRIERVSGAHAGHYLIHTQEAAFDMIVLSELVDTHR